MPRLVLEGSAPASAELTDETCDVGRLANCHLTLSEPQSSRKHFQVEPRGSRWVVVDLGSRNGTYLNEERLSEPVALRHGDAIRVGESVVRYEAAPEPLPAGTKLGSVVLDAVSGRSAWGTLYQARQGSLERDVCVEVVDPDLAGDPQLLERYQRRARAAGAFEHQCVRAVFDTSASSFKGSGQLYTVFEAFAGLTLEERLMGAGPLERGAALSVLAQVADALAHVHGRGKLHGLLSPRAVLVDAQNRVKLVDLGEEPGARLVPHQADGALLLAYASPEEAAGEPPGAPADLFSLGLLAVRLLTGRLPWGAGLKRAELLERIAADEPVPLDELEGPLRELLGQLLAHAPGQRPLAGEAARRLQELIGLADSATKTAEGRKGGRKAEPPARARTTSEDARERSGRRSSSSSDDVRAEPRGRPRDSAAVAGPARPSSSAAGPRPRDSAAGSSPARRRPASSDDEGPAPAARGSDRLPGGDRPAVRAPSGAPAVQRLRVSDRMNQPEPGWYLPVRLTLLGLGYGLLFAAAALLVRLVARL